MVHPLAAGVGLAYVSCIGACIEVRELHYLEHYFEICHLKSDRFLTTVLGIFKITWISESATLGRNEKNEANSHR
jgi:hypothetical protein